MRSGGECQLIRVNLAAGDDSNFHPEHVQYSSPPMVVGGPRRMVGVTSIYRANQTIGTLYHFASPAASRMDRGQEG